jgi:NitT/TauT family transport system permease protein
MKSDATKKEIYDSQAERRSKQRYRWRVTIGQVALIVLVLATWQFGSGRLFDPFFVGNPVGVAKILIDDLGDPRFWNDLRVTGTEMTLGYLLGGLSGIALGVLLARWRLAADIFDPFFAGLNSLPRIATLVFFLTFFTTLSGIRSVDPALVDVARVVGANERQIFRYVMLPGAAAWVINGLKMSLPYALIGVIVGEFLVASSGLGYRLNFYSTSYNTNGTFAMLLVMMALMMGLNALMVLVERYALRWRAEMTTTIQPY